MQTTYMDYFECNGVVFPPGSGNQRLSAEIQLELDRIWARTNSEASAQNEYQLAWQDAVVNFGGATGNMLFVRPADGVEPGGLTICCEAPALRSVLHDLAQRGGHAHVLSALQVHRSKQRRGRAGCFLALVLTAVVLWWTPALWRASVSQGC